MNCPRCGTELAEAVFDPESSESLVDYEHCPKCKLRITKDVLRNNMEPSDCLMVKHGELAEEEFDTSICCDCFEDCLLANTETPFDMVQDEEGNWIYPEDLDPDEWERMQ